MGTVVQELLAGQRRLPSTWEDPATGEVTCAAHEELSWSLVHHLVGHLVFKAPLPKRILVGREKAEFLVDAAAWRGLSEELGVHEPEARRHVGDELSRVLRREPPQLSPSAMSLPRLAAGLVVLLSGLARHTRAERRLSPRQGTLGFDDGTPEQSGPARVVDALLGWAGGAARTAEQRYQIAYHVVWRPLVRRFEHEAQRPAPQEPALAFPVDFLQRARTAQTGEAAADADSARDLLGVLHGVEQRHVPSEPGAAEGASGAVLQVLLEPLLSPRAEPAALIDAAEVSATGFAADVLRAWRRVLLAEELELYGTPGSVVSLRLPDRAWRVAEGPYRPPPGEGPTDVRVVRRGVLLSGEVLIPGVVVYERPRGPRQP